jgi:hypothetical protein
VHRWSGISLFCILILIVYVVRLLPPFHNRDMLYKYVCMCIRTLYRFCVTGKREGSTLRRHPRFWDRIQNSFMKLSTALACEMLDIKWVVTTVLPHPLPNPPRWACCLFVSHSLLASIFDLATTTCSKFKILCTYMIYTCTDTQRMCTYTCVHMRALHAHHHHHI